MPRRLAATSVCLFFCVGLAACASQDLQQLATKHGYSAALLQGDGFTHRTLFKPGKGDILHVYIEGDGRPWVTPLSVAKDPTPVSPLLPDLMALDAAPALYLGRPCYFKTGDSTCSDPRWWTSHRYSEAVVASMDSALSRFMAGQYRAVALIGHSGGGTLAYLLAARRPDAPVLVTLAANLNVGQWAEEHGFSALFGSLDPAALAPLPQSVRQYHYRGAQDTRVSAAVIQSVIAGQRMARLRQLEGVDHRCCWEQAWPEILLVFKQPE